MKRIGIFPNLSKPDIVQVLDTIVDFSRQENISLLFPKERAGELTDLFPHVSFAYLEESEEVPDAAIAIGGDGTLLETAKRMAPLRVPVCGIHMGTLGFLNEISRKDLPLVLQRLVRENFSIEDRVLLRSYIEKEDKRVELPDALNDIVIGRAELGKMARLNLYINDCFVQQYPADGLIISTPTGSTGYNLSSGGPIIHPKVAVFSVSPVCPHLLQNSPIVLPDTETIAIEAAHHRSELQICIDGVIGREFTENSRLVIQKSKDMARFIRFDEQYFYRTVFPKLLGVSHE